MADESTNGAGRQRRWRLAPLATRGRIAATVLIAVGLAAAFSNGGSATNRAANTVVPTDVQMPGTQQGEIFPSFTTEPVGLCKGCHGGWDKTTEPYHLALGSMMMHSGRDPIFWGQLAIAEQDFPGYGNVCMRCHTGAGWAENRAIPTNGQGLTDVDDGFGVECDICHKLTNPDGSEIEGIQNPPFIANDGGNPPEGYYGAAQMVLAASFNRLGPYTPPDCAHGAQKSKYHRQAEMCGTCHDVSNPMVGDLAHNNGAQIPLPPGSFSGVPGAPVETKAAFKTFPHQYGIVERTFSEWKSGALANLRVLDYPTLPAELKQGAIKRAYDQSGGDYADGQPRFYTCQTCHMRPLVTPGCVLPGHTPHTDMPRHDLTGGNYWVPDAIQYMKTKGTLRIGANELGQEELDALNDGKTRVYANLSNAAALAVDNNTNTLRVINLTGHKLISGYPEGRRMWLNMKWYDGGGTLLREDGQYGAITAVIGGQNVQVQTLLDLSGTNTRIYEIQMAMSQEWASQLLGMGYSPSLVLSFDRNSGQPNYTLGDLAHQAPGTSYMTFHFALNNTVAHDNRIPPYGMSYDVARERNALPVPETQFGNPGPGGAYQYWDTVPLNPPPAATTATITLYYQPTSWEYIQFVSFANNRTDPFLANVGINLLDAWLNTGMATPAVMATTTWVKP